jgi:DNA-binding FadR family transcriptional regulator
MKRCLESRRVAIHTEQRQACAEADIAFHMAIARASLNHVLADLYQSFTSVIREFFSQRETRGISHFAMSHHLHEELLEAIKRKKEKLAQLVLNKIIANNY